MKGPSGRLLCIALFVTSLFSARPSLAGTPNRDLPFSDITGHWAQEAITSATAAGYAAGYPDGTFWPDAAVTRAETVTFIVRALVAARLLTPVPSGYTRMNVAVDAATQQHWAVQGGFLPTALATRLVKAEDFPGRSLDLDAPATRLEAAIWLARAKQPALDNYILFHKLRNSSPVWSDDARRAAAVPGGGGPWPFPDSVPDDRVPYVLVDYHAGIVRGFPDGRFGGSEPITRSQLITMLQRLAPVAALAGSGRPDVGTPPTHPQHGRVVAVRFDQGDGDTPHTSGPRPLSEERSSDWPAIRRLLNAMAAARAETPTAPLQTSTGPFDPHIVIAYADGAIDRLEPLVRCVPNGPGGTWCTAETGWVNLAGRQWHATALWEEYLGQLLYFDMPAVDQSAW